MSAAPNALRHHLSGQVVLPDDPGYDDARQVFNSMHDKRPAVIARCASADDVAASVNFARDEGAPAAASCGARSTRRRRSTVFTPRAVASRRPGSAASRPAAAAAGPPAPRARPDRARGGLALWSLEQITDVLRGWRDYVDDAPDELSTAAVVITAPPEEFVPDELKGKRAVGLGAIYVGDPEAGAAAIRPLKDMQPAVDLIEPMPYTAFQAILDPTAPKGYRNYWRGEYMNGLGDDAIDTFADNAPDVAAAGAPFSQMIIFRIGQGVTAVPDDATAFSHRDANFLFHPISVWDDPADDERVIAANRAFAQAMRPFGTGGAYLNFTADADRIRDAYGDRKYDRLVGLKDKYDPDNLFRLNQNIRPSKLPSKVVGT